MLQPHSNTTLLALGGAISKQKGCYPFIENASHAGASDLWIGSVELQLMTSMFLIIYSWPWSHLSTFPLLQGKQHQLHPSIIHWPWHLSRGWTQTVEWEATCGAPAPLTPRPCQSSKLSAKCGKQWKPWSGLPTSLETKIYFSVMTLVSKGWGGNTSKNPRSGLFIQNLAANSHDYKVSNIINSLSHLIWFWQCDTM